MYVDGKGRITRRKTVECKREYHNRNGRGGAALATRYTLQNTTCFRLNAIFVDISFEETGNEHRSERLCRKMTRRRLPLLLTIHTKLASCGEVYTAHGINETEAIAVDGAGAMPCARNHY